MSPRHWAGPCAQPVAWQSSIQEGCTEGKHVPKDLALHHCLPDDGVQLSPPPNIEPLPMFLGPSLSIYNKAVGKREKTTTKNTQP